jgi:hypothetical protein
LGSISKIIKKEVASVEFFKINLSRIVRSRGKEGTVLLVSILGDFHSSVVPVSFEFKEKITTHIIVYDDAHGDTAEAKRIIKGQEAFLDAYPMVRYTLKPIRIDEDSYSSLLGCVEKIKQEADDYREIYLNATDGLSSVALVLATQLMAVGAKVIAYDRYANTYNLHTTDGMHKHSIRHSMDIRTHLLMKGYTILYEPDRAVLQYRKESIFALMEDMPRYKQFADAVGKVGYSGVQGFADYRKHLESIGDTSQQFIQGSVFEEYIYHLLLDYCDFDDVRTGMKVMFDEGVENEFDILMIKENHLHTIECKFVNNLNGEHYVYKTERVKEYLDDDGRAMILSIGADNVTYSRNGRKKVQFSKGSKARARFGEVQVHQRKVFDKKVFLDDVREWFG